MTSSISRTGLPQVPQRAPAGDDLEPTPSVEAATVAATTGPAPAWAASRTASPRPLTAGASVGAAAEIDRAIQGGASAIVKLSPETLAQATGPQRLAMIKASTPPPPQPSAHGGQAMQSRYSPVGEEAMLAVFRSAKTAGQLDYVLTRVNEGSLALSMQGGRKLSEMKKTLSLVYPGDWKAYANYLEEATGAKSSGKNKVDFLVDGAEVVPKAREMISNAKETINLAVFQFEPNETGLKLIDLLGQKASEGVKVRVLIDEYGTEGADEESAKKMIQTMKDKGIDVIVNPTPWDKSDLDHRKIMVVDGKQAFTGGMNVGDDYQKLWHDQQTMVQGPAVSKLQDAFFNHWAREGGAAPSDDELTKLYPPLSPVPGGVETYVIPHEGNKQDQNIKAAYLRAINTAEKNINVANPYFTDPDVVNALCAAAKRGVDVNIVLPAENDMPIVKRAAEAYYPQLLAAGAKVYEYQGRMAHEKVATVDGIWSTVGSSNLDARSLKINDELNLVGLDPNLAQDINTRLFEADLKNSKKVDSSEPSLRAQIDKLLGGFL